MTFDRVWNVARLEVIVRRVMHDRINVYYRKPGYSVQKQVIEAAARARLAAVASDAD
jgi:hypothetical protein